jgi:multidrug transporter EmrE-like cation transporter
MSTLWMALASICISVAAQFSLKAGMGSAAAKAAMASDHRLPGLAALLLQPRIALGFALYGLGALLWLSVLARWDVSKAYPMVGLGFVLALAIGALTGEDLGLSRVMGVGCILVGIVLVARS